MLRSLGTFSIGDKDVSLFIDEFTPIFYTAPQLTYNFAPPAIALTCVYLRIRIPSGFVYEFPINAKLELTGNLSRVPVDEREYEGVEIYTHNQLTDYMIRFCVKRCGFYRLRISNKKINEWKIVSENVFVDGLPHISYDMSIGSTGDKAWVGRTTKLLFSVYNSFGNIIGARIDSNGFSISPLSPPQKPLIWDEAIRGKWYNPEMYGKRGFGYTSGGKHTLWVDVEADNTTTPGVYRITFTRDDKKEFLVDFYLDKEIPICEPGQVGAGEIVGNKNLTADPITMLASEVYKVDFIGKVKSYVWTLVSSLPPGAVTMPSYSRFGTACRLNFDNTLVSTCRGRLRVNVTDDCGRIHTRDVYVRCSRG